MPSRDILRNQILPRFSCDIEVKLAEKLSCIKGLTVSVDGWTGEIVIKAFLKALIFESSFDLLTE
jgi:hypothetical protein